MMDHENPIVPTYEQYRLFHNLWCKVALELQKYEKLSSEDVRGAIEKLKDPFRKERVSSDFSKIDFENPTNCCAYLVRLATCHTSLTRFATEEFLVGNGIDPQLFIDELTRGSGQLSIVSLGGGPGTDAIGFCNALAFLCPVKRANVCVMELWKYWRTALRETINVIGSKIAGEHSDFFGEMEVLFEFQQVDLTAEVSDAHLKRIREADVILMVKFVSILDGACKEDLLRVSTALLNRTCTSYFPLWNF